VTASFGVSGARGAEFDFDRLLQAADTALYAAKRNGRHAGQAAPAVGGRHGK